MKTFNIFLFLVMSFLYFSYVFNSIQYIFVVYLLLCIIDYSSKNYFKKIIFRKEDYIWGCFLSVIFISTFYSNNKLEAYTFLLILFMLYLLRTSLINNGNWLSMFMFSNILFSSIHILATYVQWISPGIVNKINYLILERSVYLVNFSQQIRGKYAGITGQVGSNAFFITIFIALIISKLYISKTFKKRFFLSILLFLGFYALLLTEKRGLLLFNIITILFILIILLYKKMELKRIKSLIITSVIMIITILVWILSINSYLLEYYLFDEDISTGRVDIYKHVIEMISINPILGNGIGSIEESLNIKGHNIYLQLWAESGFFSLILFIILITSFLIFSIKIFLDKNHAKIDRNNFHDKILFSIYIQFIFILYGFTGNPLYDYFILGIYIISASIPYYVNVKKIESQKEGKFI